MPHRVRLATKLTNQYQNMEIALGDRNRPQQLAPHPDGYWLAAIVVLAMHQSNMHFF